MTSTISPLAACVGKDVTSESPGASGSAGGTACAGAAPGAVAAEASGAGAGAAGGDACISWVCTCNACSNWPADFNCSTCVRRVSWAACCFAVSVAVVTRRCDSRSIARLMRGIAITSDHGAELIHSATVSRSVVGAVPASTGADPSAGCTSGVGDTGEAGCADDAGDVSVGKPDPSGALLAGIAKTVGEPGAGVPSD